MGLLESLGVRAKAAPGDSNNADTARHNRGPSSPETHGKDFTATQAVDDLQKLLAPSWIGNHHKIAAQLYSTCQEHDWFELCGHEPTVVIRSGVSMSDYIVYPTHLADYNQRLYTAARKIQFEGAVLIATPLVSALMEDLPYNVYEIILTAEKHIQVIDNLQDLHTIKRDQMAAFIRDSQQLLVWSQQVDHLVSHIKEFEAHILMMISQPNTTLIEAEKMALLPESAWISAAEVEEGMEVVHGRTQPLLASISVACAILLLSYFLGSIIGGMIFSVSSGASKYQFVMLAYLPIMVPLAAFFAIVAVLCVLQVAGPTAQVKTNSRYYSAQKVPKRLTKLPHITIQCPIYKEDLADVIRPTIHSVRKAIGTYERQGGTANLYVNDDGMQVISKQEATFRQEFYRNNGIGWVARPPQSDTYMRQGKFKKGSNMNYCLDVSLRVEDRLENTKRGPEWTAIDEATAQATALAEVLAESEPRGWGEGDVRIGDLILLIDSDTRIPGDCFYDAASEFAESEDLAILQCASGVLQVTRNFWENSVAHFTRNIYFAIQTCCAAGEVSAFVGHNAYLRWTAMQEVMYLEDGKMKWWSELHVSEDFIMSMKMHMLGYISRLSVYDREGYQEGVSLTVYDELLRWTKYSYGCSELVFHPLKYWFWKGPITPLFRQFIRSDIPTASKFTISAYIFSYYAIASALWLNIVNYCLAGWFPLYLQHDYSWYLDSFNVTISVMFIFVIITPFTNAVQQYRLARNTFWSAYWDNVKYSLIFTVFLGGLSYHVSVTLAKHMLGIDVQWGATAKTLPETDFLNELPALTKKFWKMYLVLFVIVSGMIIMTYAPIGWWQIDSTAGYISLGWMVVAHALVPLIFNRSSYLGEIRGDLNETAEKVFISVKNLLDGAKATLKKSSN